MYLFDPLQSCLWYSLNFKRIAIKQMHFDTRFNFGEWDLVIKVSHQQELREGLDAPESDDGLPISLVKAAACEQTNLEAEVITN